MRVAPKLIAACNKDGGAARNAARAEIIIVGKVMSDNTSPPTSGEERGMLKTLRKTASPSNPKITEGTAAKLLILISAKSSHRFHRRPRGANNSKYNAAKTPAGKDIAKVSNKVKKEP